MSFEKTKSALISALALRDTPVIALHGPWGSGKTHLWMGVSASLENEGKATPLYVSCMAYGSSAALKSAIITILLSRSSSLAKHGEKIFNLAVRLVNTKLPEELQFSTSLSDIQALLPTIRNFLPTNTLLVLDDIERAVEIDIRELLGFVGFLTNQLQIRVMLILNKSKLGEKQEAWEQLREKIISIEISLEPTPADCVSIGIGELPKAHLNVFSDRAHRLGVTNIRALQHMRRTYDALKTTQPLNDEHWTQLIPSIVLLTAIHLNAIENGPTIEQAITPFFIFGKKKPTEQEENASKMLGDYNLGTPDIFETKILVPYLRTGHLDGQAFAAYATEIHRRNRSQAAGAKVKEFALRYKWDGGSSVDDLLTLFESLRQFLDVLNESYISQLADIVVQLGAPERADSFVKSWVEHNMASISTMPMDEYFFDSYSLDFHKIHPFIQAAYQKRYDALHSPLSLKHAIEYLAAHNSWANRHSTPIVNSTQSEIDELVCGPDFELRERAFRFFAPYVRGGVHGGSFHPAAERFIEACRKVTTNEPASRLASIIQREFQELGAAGKLNKPITQ
ncbi:MULTISPECIES: P-loop NTPase fold protein [Corallococcus]|uniref:P-loop NTPase fold protein n=1 Tax=Corallococcus TaxID=83461 RepID=UPI000F862D4D|nr:MULTISPECIES: P-loop NTPase fold protein [Corallococcus]NRD53254.1 ATP-binding protein [Corallococcus exiguus]